MKKARDEKGMMTVEVVIGLVVYMAFFVLLLNILNIMYIRQKMQVALKLAAVQMSRDYRLNEEMLDMSGDNAPTVFFNMQNKTYSFYRSESNPYIPTGDWKKEAESTLRFEIYEKIGNGYSISYLEDLGIVNGRFGLSLDGSTIDNTYGGSVDLTLNYRIRVVNLPFFEGAGIDINMEQHACTKLW